MMLQRNTEGVKKQRKKSQHIKFKNRIVKGWVTMTPLNINHKYNQKKVPRSYLDIEIMGYFDFVCFSLFLKFSVITMITFVIRFLKLMLFFKNCNNHNNKKRGWFHSRKLEFLDYSEIL